jgi:hypothetical protein
MNPHDQKPVPHTHRCFVDGEILGCTDLTCKLQLWVYCDKHEEVANTAVVHHFVGDPAELARTPLLCCGKLVGQTTPGDRMTADPREVTCTGAIAADAPSFVYDPVVS